MYVYAYECISIYIYIYIYTHVYLQHECINNEMCMCVYIYIYTYSGFPLSLSSSAAYTPLVLEFSTLIVAQTNNLVYLLSSLTNSRRFHCCYRFVSSLAMTRTVSFQNFMFVFCGLDPGNLKFETVRTHKLHICF